MSFVGEPFKHDVFITYSHGDADGDGHSLLKQWSEGFARELEQELQLMQGQLAGIKVFRDQHARPGQALDPMAPLTEQLKEDITGSAILAILMTPHYLNSNWCGDERSWWLEAQKQNELQVNGRLAVAHILPTTDSDWPEALVDSRGHKLVGQCFYDRSSANARPFEWPQPKSTSGDPFRGTLVDYIGNLMVHLKDLRSLMQEKERQKTEALRLAADGGQAIYLHGSQENSQVWEDVWSDLESAGFQVYPSEPDPITTDLADTQKISKGRIEILKGCDALLLVGTDDTRMLDADLVVVGRNERHQARAFSDKLMPCAVVDKAGLADTRQRILTNARRLGVHWFKAQDESWTSDIPPWLSGAGI